MPGDDAQDEGGRGAYRLFPVQGFWPDPEPGDAVGADTVAGAGTESAQSLTVYGRIPPQTTPAPGVYTDTIVMTVTY